MPRGRAPAPTKLKLLAGKPKSQINDDEPMPDETVPQCPSTDEDVREVWDYTVGQLKAMRIITMADRDSLYGYCQAVVDHRKASEMINRDGPVVTVHVGSGPVHAPHPAIRVQAATVGTIKVFAQEFGLTPASRSRIKVTDSKAPADKSDQKPAARLLSM